MLANRLFTYALSTLATNSATIVTTILGDVRNVYKQQMRVRRLSLSPFYLLFSTQIQIVKPCPHWRLQWPNSATVAVFFGDCRRFRRLSPNSASNYRTNNFL